MRVSGGAEELTPRQGVMEGPPAQRAALFWLAEGGREEDRTAGRVVGRVEGRMEGYTRLIPCNKRANRCKV